MPSLPSLLLLIYLSLRRNLHRETREPLHRCFLRTNQAWPYLGLLALPLAALLIYAGAYHWEMRWQTNWVLYLITTPAGLILLIINYFKVWWMKAVINENNN